jgi:hypothetical protein
MVVGFGNRAGDKATQLVGIADEVYIAHQHGACVLPRGIDGQPIEHAQSLRLFTILKYSRSLANACLTAFSSACKTSLSLYAQNRG